MTNSDLYDFFYQRIPTLVASHIKRNPDLAYLKDEMTSEAFLKLAECLESTKYDIDNPVHYIDRAVLMAICNTVDLYQPLSERTRQRTRAEGAKLIVEEQLTSDHTIEDHRKSTAELFEEVISQVANDETDVQILRMREEGYNDREIGEKLGIDRSKVNYRRRKMAKKWQN